MQADGLRASLFLNCKKKRILHAVALTTLQSPQGDRISGKRRAQSFTIPVAAFFACHEPVNNPAQQATESHSE